MGWSDPQSRAAYYAAYAERNKERIAVRRKAFRQRNGERLAAKSRAYHAENKERANARNRAYSAAYRQQDPARYAALKTAERQRLRTELIAAYGGKCACCGEAEPAFLQLDHVNGGGNKERLMSGGKGGGVLRRLRREGFPPGYQVLCANCNYAKAFNPGGCPHQSPP